MQQYYLFVTLLVLIGWSTSRGDDVVIDMDGDNVVVGVVDSAGQGSAYTYTINGVEKGTVTNLPKSSGSTNDRYGCAVAIEGTIIAIGAEDDDSSNGAVFIFTESGSSWSEATKMTAVSTSNFGASVSLRRGALFVGCPSAVEAQIITGSGATWGIANWLYSNEASFFGDDGFGKSIDFDPDSGYLAVGAPNANSDTGFVSIISINPNNLQGSSSEIKIFHGSQSGTQFGHQVQISDNILVVGTKTKGAAPITVIETSSWTTTFQLSAPTDWDHFAFFFHDATIYLGVGSLDGYRVYEKSGSWSENVELRYESDTIDGEQLFNPIASNGKVVVGVSTSAGDYIHSIQTVVRQTFSLLLTTPHASLITAQDGAKVLQIDAPADSWLDAAAMISSINWDDYPGATRVLLEGQGGATFINVAVGQSLLDLDGATSLSGIESIEIKDLIIQYTSQSQLYALARVQGSSVSLTLRNVIVSIDGTQASSSDQALFQASNGASLTFINTTITSSDSQISLPHSAIHSSSSESLSLQASTIRGFTKASVQAHNVNQLTFSNITISNCYTSGARPDSYPITIDGLAYQISGVGQQDLGQVRLTDCRAD